MDETTTEASNAPTPAPSPPSPSVQPKPPSPCVCKVCGAPAQYSYFGAVVCQPCKVFFKRNALIQPVPFKCGLNENCDIDINTRRSCSYCRLAKCFAVGMSTEMIRSSRDKPNKKRQKTNDATTNTMSTALVRINENNEPPQIPTLNLLQADISTLNVDQWNHLSNLVHCFDEYSGTAFIQSFIDEQTALPPKFRFKYSAVNQFFLSMMSNVQLVFEKNRDHISLSSHDRETLLRSTVAYTTTIGGAFLLRQTHLFDRPDFSQSAEFIFRPTTVALTKRLIDQLDPDIILMKILLAIIAFSLSNNTTYTFTPERVLTDEKAIVRIQDMYAELIWRYLLYKHNYHDAVLCFSNLVRCLLLVNNSVAEAFEAQEFMHMMDSVIECTKQKLTLNT